MYTQLSTHSKNIDDLNNPTQQNKLYLTEESILPFTDDTDMQCDYSISAHTPDIPNTYDNHSSLMPIHTAAHSQ